MGINFECPNAVRTKKHLYILCGKKMKVGEDYNNTQTAMTAYCPHQKDCSCERRRVNTTTAKECYKLDGWKIR